jgi:hypothetical protein
LPEHAPYVEVERVASVTNSDMSADLKAENRTFCLSGRFKIAWGDRSEHTLGRLVVVDSLQLGGDESRNT